MRVSNIGKYFKSKTTFTSEDSIFTKGSDYQLIDLVEEDIFTLYIFDNKLMYGDYDNEFNDKFIKLEDERVRNLNKILYED